MNGRTYLDRILKYRDNAGSGSSLLDAIGSLPHDGHDAVGAITIAQQGLAEIAAEDPFRPALERILKFETDGRRLDGHAMKGILFICDEAIAAAEQTATPSLR